MVWHFISRFGVLIVNTIVSASSTAIVSTLGPAGVDFLERIVALASADDRVCWMRATPALVTPSAASSASTAKPGSGAASRHGSQKAGTSGASLRMRESEDETGFIIVDSVAR
jgi:hypothetical protein